MSQKNQEFFPSLEGIRAYAFVAVFFIHYNWCLTRPTQLSRYPAYIASNVGWFLVPIFFVLSGFLITRILLATKERGGYFKAFYFRRAIRVLPLYYMVVIPIGLVALLCHWQLRWQHLLFLVYLQNLTVVGFNFQNFVTHPLQLNHLWSLALEEQFYLVWPLIIYLLRTEKSLLRFSYGIIAACMLFRFAWPLWHMPYEYAYFITPSRADGIILGAVLAIHYKRMTHWIKFVKVARILIPSSIACLLLILYTTGSTWVSNYVGVAFCIPLMNLLGACFVILAIQPGSLVNKVCSGERACRLGRLSYGMYLFHEIYNPFLAGVADIKLTHYVSNHMAHAIVDVLSLALTIGLAQLAYRYVEVPMMRFKDMVKYGARQPAPVRTLQGELRPQLIRQFRSSNSGLKTAHIQAMLLGPVWPAGVAAFLRGERTDQLSA